MSLTLGHCVWHVAWGAPQFGEICELDFPFARSSSFSILAGQQLMTPLRGTGKIQGAWQIIQRRRQLSENRLDSPQFRPPSGAP